MTKAFFASFLLFAIPWALPAQQLERDTLSARAVRVGYVSGNAQALTGAVDQVTAERMNKGLITSSLDALSGRAAGVQVSSGGNQEAMVSAVRVRGTTSLTGANDPLVIIDGVTSELATLSTIYPADIESFTILKDASQTAQYGSRGAAGVIEVATKKGAGRQFHISYDGSVGFEAVGKRSFCAISQLRSRTSAAASLSIILRERYDAPLAVTPME
jgi:TonB-dependent SusC/RagA subfamily outer membrane receptor